ncbi:MAG: hypothetical protein Q9M19_01030 [Mariprofundaceae bacterium]|nr:hypothetical protein [Mariprofundaceae bacterium]
MHSMQINKSYDFTTLAPALLGAVYTNMKVKGIVTMEEAVKYSDVVTLHESVKSIITGLPNTAHDLVFIILVDTDGQELVLAQDYIDSNTIVMVTTTNLDIKIFNVDSSMEAIIKLRLRELGILSFKVETF